MRVRAWLADVLWVVVATVGVLLLASLLLAPGEKPAMAVGAALQAGLVMLGFRRRKTLIVGIVALVVTYPLAPALFTVLGMLAVLAMLAYRYDWRVAAIGWVAAYTAMMAISGPLPNLLQVIANAILTGAPIAFGRYLRGVRSAAVVAEERVVETEAWRQAETRAAVMAERSRLARDLHDIVAHHVGAMTLRASSARLAVKTSGDVAVADDALGDIVDTGRHVLDDLRGLLGVLRDPDAIDDEAMVTEPKAAIADAVARVRGAGVPVTLDLDRGLGGASLLVRTTAARIAQEALTNVLKHAGPGTATRLSASVDESSTVWLRIDNDAPAGQPAAPAALPASGHGLAGMRDRVALLGGVLTAGPTPEGGWSVAANLPAPGVQEAQA